MKTLALAGLALLLISRIAFGQDEHEHHEHHEHVTPPEDPQAAQSEQEHVPPDPPAHFMGDMSNERMIELMQMDDNAAHGMVLMDQLEWREIDDEDATAWELQAWYGNDFDKVWLESEGERAGGEEEARVELLWDRVMSRWWSFQGGVRQDLGAGPSRTWASIGVQGLAPYFFEVDAALYVGEGGRTAARLGAEYEMLITQRLVLQPELEFNLYGKDDTRNGIESGLSDVELGLRLRYEIRREFAPYVGFHWERKFGDTADLTREAGDEVSDLTLVAGLRAWF